MKYAVLVTALLALFLTACGGEKHAEAPAAAPAPVAESDAHVDEASAPSAPAEVDSMKK